MIGSSGVYQLESKNFPIKSPYCTIDSIFAAGQLSLRIGSLQRHIASIRKYSSILINEFAISDLIFRIHEQQLMVRVGSTFVGKQGETHRIKKIHANPNYSSWSLDYDIALLELAIPVRFSAASAPISLPQQDQDIPAGSEAVVTGWGKLSEMGTFADQLQAVKVPMISLSDCRVAYDRPSITDRMICAGVYGVGGKDACQVT